MKRMMASCLVFSALALTISVRTVCPRSEGTSLPCATMRILPSLISCRPNGGAAQPMSIWPDITAVSVRGRAAGRRRLGLGAELLHEGDDDVVRARAVGRIGDGGLGRRVLQAFDLGIGLHVPVQVAGAGERRRQDAHRRALGEGAHDAGGADAGADIGRAGDHRLDGFAGALRADILQHQAVLLEDAGVLAERRRLVFPVVDLADRELERVLGGRRACRRAPAARPAPSAAAIDLEGLHSIPPFDFFYRWCSPVGGIQHRCRPLGKPKFQRRRAFGARRGFAAAVCGLGFLAAPPAPRRLWPPASTSIPTSA